MKSDITNIVALAGKIISEPVLHTTFNGMLSYLMLLESTRPSGRKDFIELQLPQALFVEGEEYQGKMVRLKGELHSCYEKVMEIKKRVLKVRVLVSSMEFWEENWEENLVYLDSWLSKAPIYKVSKDGQAVTQLLLSVRRANTGKIDTLCCSCWGKDAEIMKGIRVGSALKVTGRLCSWGGMENQDEQKYMLYVSMFDYEFPEDAEVEADIMKNNEADLNHPESENTNE